jgi:hypothetical protein
MRYYMEGLDMSDLERMSGLPRPPLARRSHSEVPAGTPDEAAHEEKRPRTTEDLRAGIRFWGGEGTAVVSSSEEEEEEEEGSGSESEEEEDDDEGEDAAEDDGEDEGEDPLALFGHR